MSLKSVLSTSMQVGKRRRLLVNLSVAAIIVVALTASLGSLALAASSFPDVPASHPNYAAITDLADRGIISGKTDGKFDPNDPVTRQQFAKMIVGTGGYPVSEANVCPFGDVTVSGSGDLYPDNFVAVCAAQGITLGKTETTFDPTGNITRYQVISMVVRTTNDLQPGLLAAPPAGYGAWAGDPTHGANAARAEYNDLLAGLDLASLNPLGNMTRGEVAQVLHNLLVKLGGSPGTTGSSVPGATYTLSVSTAGTGSGTVAKIPDQTTFAAGSTVVLTATAATGSVFMGWSGDASGDTNPLTLTMDSNKTIVATFNAGTVLYSLNTSVPGGGGTITKSPDQALYPSGTSVQLTAVPATGYTFHHWTGAVTGITNPASVTMDSHKTVQAVFVPATTYTLTLSATPHGQGSISRSPNKASYNAGEQVTLTATPAAGYHFGSWSGSIITHINPVVVTMDSDKNITANFVADTYTLNVTVSPAGKGVVLRNKQAPYAAGTEVWLTANADPGYRFDHWSGDASGTSNPLKVTMDSNKNITAHYVLSYTLHINIRPDGAGTVTRSPSQSSYAEGTTVTVQANPAAGYVFDYWTGDLSGSTATRTLTMNEDKAITAWFKHTPVVTLTFQDQIGNGHVTKTPARVTLYQGETVTLTAHPDPGWHFVRWWGGIASTSNPVSFVMTGNRYFCVTFERD